MINTRILSILLCLSFVSIGVCQEFNRLDEKGRKQGPFKKFFEGTDQVFYTGQFKDDVPQGHFIYYFKEGGKKADMHYSSNGQQVRTSTYHSNGQLMAEGRYVGRKKDSLWTYYDRQGRLRSTEGWKVGLKHGEEKAYFPAGGLAEELIWQDSLRQGAWVQYHENGKPSIEGGFQDDLYHGQMTFYYENGRKEISGRYEEGVREGTWLYYNEDGSIRLQALYRDGVKEKERKENGTFYEYGTDREILSEITYENGLKNGPFNEYHDDAMFKLEETPDPQTGEKVLKEVKYGNELKRSGNFKDDQLHGVVKYYDSSGQLLREERYIDGALQ